MHVQDQLQCIDDAVRHREFQLKRDSIDLTLSKLLSQDGYHKQPTSERQASGGLLSLALPLQYDIARAIS